FPYTTLFRSQIGGAARESPRGEGTLAARPVHPVSRAVPDVVERVAGRSEADGREAREPEDARRGERAQRDPAAGEDAERGEQQIVCADEPQHVKHRARPGTAARSA